MFQSLVQTHQQLETEPDVAEAEKENRQREQLTQGGNSCEAFTVPLKALYGAGLRLQEQEHKQ